MSTTPGTDNPAGSISATTKTSKTAAPKSAPKAKSKASKILDKTVDIGTCPACQKTITGSAVLELHVEAAAGGGLTVEAKTTTKVRSFRVTHACTGA